MMRFHPSDARRDTGSTLWRTVLAHAGLCLALFMLGRDAAQASPGIGHDEPTIGQDGTTKPVPSETGSLLPVFPEGDRQLLGELEIAKRKDEAVEVRDLQRRLGWTESSAGETGTEPVVLRRMAGVAGSPGGPDPLVYDQRVSEPAWSTIEPCVASRADGTLYCVAIDVGGNFVDVYRSTNDGYGWVYEFSLVAAIPRNPSIVIGEGNTNRLVIAYESDRGGPTSSIRVFWHDLDTLENGAVTVQSQPFGTLARPRICVDSPEYGYWYPYLTWTQGVLGVGEVESVQFSRSLDFGATFEAPRSIEGGLPSGTQCDVDFGGSLLNLVYSKPSPSGDRDIVLRRSADFGATFDAGTAIVASPYDEFEPRVASTASGGLTAIVFTKRYSASNTDIESMVTTDGSIWTLSYLPFTSDDEGMPDIAANFSGEGIHAVFLRGDQLRSSTVGTSKTWMPGRAVNEGSLDPSYAPAVATTPARTQEAAVVWTQQTPDGARILFDAEYPVGGFDIVVADSQLEAAVASLAAWKESIGYRVSVISVPTIFEIYGTGDDAERIYAYLADRSADVRHVLLVGDVDLLPMRMLYPSDTRPAYGSDFYYADAGNLNWDHDLDGRWGEFVDDALDPNPDLIVGRAPFDDPADVQAFCSGVIAFEQATGAWKRDVLLANGFLDHVEGWAGDPVTDTAYASERIIGDVLAPRGWGSATLYEKIGISTSPFSCDADLLQANFLSRIGWGRHGLVSTNAHGEPGSKAGLQWMSDINGNFVRDLPEESRYNSFSNWGDIAAHPAAGAVCLWGCSTGVVFGDFAGFAGSPLRSRYLIRTPRSNTMMKEYLRHGAGAVVASTAGADYSPGWTQPGDGRIQSLSYYFFEQLGEGPRRIGDAFYAASVKYASVHGLARGLRVFHVFGDPTLSVDDITLPPGSRESALLSWQARIAPTVSISDRRRTDSFEATSREPASPGPVPQGGEMPPLVWDQVTRPAESIAILSLERVGDVLLAGGIRRGATGNQGTIFRSTDQGDSWVPQDFPGVASIRVVERTGSGRLVAGGMGEDPGGNPAGVVFTSDDDGATWDARLVSASCIITDVTERGSGELFAVTTWNGRIFRSTDDGSNWTQVAALGVDVGIAAITAADERLLVALDAPVGLAPVLYSDDGVAWSPPLGGLADVDAAHDVLVAPGEVYAGVEGSDGVGAVYRSTDAGLTWNRTGALGDGDISAVLSLYHAPDDAIYAGGSTGWGPSGTQVYRLPTGVADWELVGGEVDLANQVRSIIASGSMLYLGTGDIYGNIYRLGLDSSTDVPQGPGVSDEPVAIGVSVYPNPFTTSVTLRFGLARSGPARIEIFDARGRRVIRLDHGESLPAGRHEVEWSGRDRSGEAAPAGIYFYKVTTFRGAERGSLTLTR